MSGRKRNSKCLCPPKRQKQCRQTRLTDCKQVISIIKALTDETESRAGTSHQKPKFKAKYKPHSLRHDSKACIPMVPSMHTRLRIRGEHCRFDPMENRDINLCARGRIPYKHKSQGMWYDLEMPESDEKPTNKVMFGGVSLRPNTLCCSVNLPTPPKVIKHTASNKSMLRVPSPKASGEIVNARPASVSNSQHRAPMPSKKDFEVHKPRSGLYINVTDDFVPDEDMGGPYSSYPSKKGRFSKGGGKKRMGSHRRRLQNYRKQALKRRQLKDRRKRGQQDHYTNFGVPDDKPQHERSTQKHLRDDESICGLDEIPKPEHVTIPKNLKRGTLQTHSLTVLPCPKGKKPEIHFGILTGSFNMYDSKYGKKTLVKKPFIQHEQSPATNVFLKLFEDYYDIQAGPRTRGKQALPMSVMAYCLAFHYHPKQWTMKLMDNILTCGDQWYIQLLDKVHDHSSVQGMCEVIPFGKKQTLILNGKKMQILLNEPDVVGYTMSLDPTVYNLCRGLKVFFKDHKAGIFLTRILKVIIWKDRVCFYVFDPAGRDSKGYANYNQGQAALINVQDLEGVAEILLARSVIEDQKYVLAALKVLRMADEHSQEDFGSDHEMTPAEKAMAEYRILSETCAIVNASLHLGDPCFEEAKFRQALPIAIMAMTYAKISPPNTWHSKTLDKIMRLGTKLFMDCSNPAVLLDITIDNIPTEIIIGPYKCEIIIYRERVKGQLFTVKDCLLNIKLGLQDFFSKEYNSGILQFNNYTLGVWRQKDMYYLFDPYPRSTEGLKATMGKACVLMNLNPASIAEMFQKNWDYLPVTTQFYIHAFKVLKLARRQEFKTEIVCTMSDEELPGERRKPRRRALETCHNKGDGVEYIHRTTVPIIEDSPRGVDNPPVDEEHMGDIISLVDSIHEDYVPQIPLKYKYAQPEPYHQGMANLDSPTVSVTQIIPPWPQPRDKTGEPPEPDPDPEPEPVPEPPKEEPGEGAEGLEEEAVEEEEAEEEEEVKKEEPPVEPEELPPPPPSPQPEPELAPPEMTEGEAQTLAQNIRRKVLLTKDARYRFKLREMRRRVSPPLEENELARTASEELEMPSNFKDVPDGTQIIQGSKAITSENVQDVLPFAAIMAIVTSYKYAINTWSKSLVDFVVDTAKKLFDNKREKFQFAPVHQIPKIAIGKQAYQANIEVASEGATWQLESVLGRYLRRYDRCMITTAFYSCAVFRKNGLYYLFDASPCNPVGLRECGKSKTSTAAFLRFNSLHGLVHRFLYNKDGDRENQQCIISRIVVRRLVKPPREILPDAGENATKTKTQYLPEPRLPAVVPEPKVAFGYQLIGGQCRIEGSTSLDNNNVSPGVKECHFVSLVAMLLLAMHPIRTWDSRMIDTAIEKGLEIYEKACNLNLCEKRVIKNILLEDKFFNLNIKKVMVINENCHKTLEQYLNAVLTRLRYVIIRYPETSMVIYQNGPCYHLFDPYPPPGDDESESDKPSGKPPEPVASWTLYNSLEALVNRIRLSVSNADQPMFYTFELTSVKKSKRAAFNYKLSPIFRAEMNPRRALSGRKKVLPIVDERITWLSIKRIPWTRASPHNDLGYERKTPRTMWRDWDIEFPGDLYSLWGTIHPLYSQFEESNRGKQILAVNVVAIAMTQYFALSEWTENVLDATVVYGDKYHKQSAAKLKDENYEMQLTDLDQSFEMYPYSFSATFDKVIFGTVYSIHKDRMNLSRALVYFFEQNHKFGILTCISKNLAFGMIGNSYFMFDCQSYGWPLFAPSQGSAYMLKCESLNRLIFCMTLTLNIKRHGVQFDLFKVEVKLSSMK